LLLNVPPDRRGLLHDRDVAALKGFKALLDSEFRNNLATNAACSADHHRGDLQHFEPGHLTDGNPETYWTTDDDVTTGSVEITLDKATQVKYIVLQEYIKLGQRVKRFDVEAYTGGAWVPLASGTTIGYKRILKVEPAAAEKIRVNITAAKACPVLSNAEVY
jgi:alpha-L-fucosidase